MGRFLFPFAIAASLLAFAPASDAQDPAPAPPPVPTVPADRLPSLGVVGDFPPAEESVLLEIGPDGETRADGKVLDRDGFLRLMIIRANRVRERAGEPSLNVVIRADCEASWAAVMPIQAACMAFPIKTNRLFFVARPSDGGSEGVVAAFGLRLEPWEPIPKDVPVLQLELQVEGGNDAPVGASLQAYLDETFRNDWVASAELKIHPDVSVGAVLEAADALLRRGVRGILFMPATVAGPARRGGASPRVLVFGKPVPPAPPSERPAQHLPARRTGALVGSFGYPGSEEGGPPPGMRPGRLFVSTPRLPVFSEFDAPPPKGAVVVHLTPTPTLRVGKENLDLREFQALLRKASEGKYEEDESRGSKVDVVIRADGDCRWQDIQWVLQAGADPDIRVYRTRFAGRSPGDGAEGSVACFLPRFEAKSDGVDPPSLLVVLVRGSTETDSRILALQRPVGRTGSPAAWESLRSILREQAGKSPGVLGMIGADPDVPYREVMAVLDTFRIAGIREVRFRGAR